TATAVITTLRSNVETTAERFERLTDSTAKLEGVTDSAVAVMERLSQAIDERGEKSLAASDKIIAATINEFESKKKLVELERVQEQKLQAERVRELNALKERRDLIEGELQANLEIYRSAREGLNSAGIDQINKAISDALVDANQEAVELDRNIKGLEASISIAADSIRKSGEIIGTTFDPTGPVEYSARIDAATKKVTEFVEKNITSAERQQRITEELSNARAVLVAEYGEEAEIVNRLDEAMRRFQGELSKATGETDGLTNAAIRLNNALQNIANANLNVRDQIAVARARLQAAEQGADSVTVSAVGEAQEVSQRLQKLGATPDRIKQAYDQTLELNKELGETNRKVNEALNPATGGSSGGGGAGTPVAGEIDEIEREALAFVQSMQTQQERLIDQTSRLKEVRAKLVQQFGEESTAVRQLDVAMERFRETSFNTFDGLLDRATQLATEVSSVTDFVSQLIAEMIRLNGADAFKSLFSGGGISGFLNELVGIGTEAVSGIILNASDGGGITPTINTPNIEPGSLSPTLNSQQVVNVTPPAGFQAQTRQSQSGRQVDIGFTKAVVSAMGTQTGKASITNNFGISQTPKG
ncbi:MAG: hypothetical protein CMM07_25555, partial [Rhodopirellula sp.]|nr:hypothetical protein [Rhodopirellula sp.]